MTYITAYQLVMTRNMIFRVTRDDKVHHVDSELSWKLLCSLTLKTKNVLRSKPGDEGRFCSWRLVYYVGHLESKERLRIQPARLFNLLKPTGHVMYQQFNIRQLYVLPTLYLCVLYLSENIQRLVPLTP